MHLVLFMLYVLAPLVEGETVFFWLKLRLADALYVGLLLFLWFSSLSLHIVASTFGSWLINH